MRRTAIIIITSLVALAGAVHTRALTPAERSRVTDSIAAELPHLTTASDSLAAYYNLFDLAQGRDKYNLPYEIYGLAVRAGDTGAQLDALRNMANVNMDNDSIVSAALDLARQYPSSDPEVVETVLFIRMLKTRLHVAGDTDGSSSRELTELINSYHTSPPTDPSERVVLLYALCQYLSAATEGDMLESYQNQLGSLISEMHLPVGAVERLFYNHATVSYSRQSRFPPLLRAERRMLQVIDSLEEHYRAVGRPYRQFEQNRYSCYRRLLGCYSLMSHDSVEICYNKILKLAWDNPRVAADLNNNGRARIYYLLANGRYAEARDLIKAKLDVPANLPYRERLLRALVLSARETGDERTLSEASQMLNATLDENMVLRRNQNYRELQLLHDLNQLRETNMELEIRSHETRTRAAYIALAIGVAVIVVLLILAGMLYRKNRKEKKLVDHLNAANHNLRAERDKLRHAQQELIVARDEARKADKMKSEFIDNMSHEVSTPLERVAEYARLIVDCVPGEKRKYLDRFANNIEFNVKLITSLVHDVLDVAEMESDTMKIKSQPNSLHELLQVSVDNIFDNDKLSHPGLGLMVNPGLKPDVSVNTDKLRASQIFMNLLGNAQKFTEKGSITIDYDVNNEAGTVDVSVTDTGIGIPNGLEEMIFSRFYQVDSSVQGVGLGLFIVRRIAELIGATVRVDASYRSGARFIVTLPLAKGADAQKG